MRAQGCWQVNVGADCPYYRSHSVGSGHSGWRITVIQPNNRVARERQEPERRRLAASGIVIAAGRWLLVAEGTRSRSRVPASPDRRLAGSPWPASIATKYPAIMLKMRLWWLGARRPRRTRGSSLNCSSRDALDRVSRFSVLFSVAIIAVCGYRKRRRSILRVCTFVD
jgi:hypothetical protein